MATIDDVAKAAGVSKGTVSNVFSRKRPVSDEVSRRVLEAARQLNFRPNYWARSLSTKQTRIIGLNMPGERAKFSHFHLNLLNGALQECFERGYRLLVDTLADEFQQRVEYVASSPTDGEILLDPRVNDPRIAERVEENTPVVVIGRPAGAFINRVSYVDNDNVEVARRVTEYLIQCHHRHILFLNTIETRTVAEDRAKGYRLAFEEAGLRADARLLLHQEPGSTSIEFGYRKFKEMLSRHPHITAVITDTDKMALGVYRAAAEAGVRIPQDLSVFAFSDDSVFAPEFSPPLSGVRLNAEVLGAEAARMLIEQLSSDTSVIKRVLVPFELVVRDSCAPVSAE
ncbi:LacI family DNA-binding transcriptional regulator [Alicyclobacillus macrosporangiidus]|uniref:LacI family DNA-binding transcriptional regulator n=1 Tax=Alicyclobacillus macrosporangiidus TaxID=392015 RepID=UPI00049516EF|nr:LacI family DNA-binding transcriptional regulator [Alicyclobacillus macrosporangiidus]